MDLQRSDPPGGNSRTSAAAFLGDTRLRGCNWDQWRATPTRDGFQVHHGSGYGLQRVVNFSREDGAWKIVAIRDEDFGPP